jgi:hypothetical protein
MKRREFLSYLTAGMGVAALEGKAVRRLRRSRRISPSAYLLSQRIGVSSWSFHNFFPQTRPRDYRGSDETLALLDFPRMIADRYKIHHLEFGALHFASTELAYLDELHSQLFRARSYLENLSIDVNELSTQCGLSDANESVRSAAVEIAKKWIDIAAHLRARSISCDPGKINPQNQAPTIDSYRKLVPYASRKGIHLLVENRRGVGSDRPEDLVKLITAVNSRYFGVLPDFGYFPDATTRVRGLNVLFNYASTVCHATGLEFDAKGNETKYNFADCNEIAKREHFRGVYSVEFEGSGDAYSGVQNVINELLRYV